jgi:uncharacterized protein (DUF433 family)
MRQRSFRLASETLDLLERRAGEHNESANSLAQRLIDEGLRLERHPLIWFRSAAGGRRPALAGSRLDVWQVIQTLRGEGNDLAGTAEYFEIPEAHVRACVSYYAEFSDEIDAWIEAQEQSACGEQERLEREQRLLA